MKGWHFFFLSWPCELQRYCKLLAPVWYSNSKHPVNVHSAQNEKQSESKKTFLLIVSVSIKVLWLTQRGLQTYPCHRWVSGIVFLRYMSVVSGDTHRIGNDAKFTALYPLGNSLASQAPSMHHRNKSWARTMGCWAMQGAGVSTWRLGSSDCWAVALCLLVPLSSPCFPGSLAAAGAPAARVPLPGRPPGRQPPCPSLPSLSSSVPGHAAALPYSAVAKDGFSTGQAGLWTLEGFSWTKKEETSDLRVRAGNLGLLLCPWQGRGGCGAGWWGCLKHAFSSPPASWLRQMGTEAPQSPQVWWP